MRVAGRLAIWMLRAGVLAALAWAAPAALALAPSPSPLRIYALDSKPVSFLDGAQPSGMVVELARAIQRRVGDASQIAIVPWTRARLLVNTQANVLVLSMVRTPERIGSMSFIGPVLTSRAAAYMVKDSAAGLRLQDPTLHNLRAGARRGSIFAQMALEQGYWVTDQTNTSETAAKMLMNRRFDLWFDGEELMPEAIRHAGYRPDDLEVAFKMGTEDIYFVFSAGTPRATVDAWRAAFRDMKRDGSFQKLHRRWLPAHALPMDNAPQY